MSLKYTKQRAVRFMIYIASAGIIKEMVFVGWNFEDEYNVCT